MYQVLRVLFISAYIEMPFIASTLFRDLSVVKLAELLIANDYLVYMTKLILIEIIVSSVVIIFSYIGTLCLDSQPL